MAEEKNKRKRKPNPNRVPVLTKRAAKFVENVSSGMNKYQSALAAGYSHSTAKRTNVIENSPAVREAFRQLFRERFDAEKVAEVVEGARTATRDGKPDHATRLAAADRIVKWGQYHVDRQEIELDDKRTSDAERLEQIFASAIARASAAPNAAGEDGSKSDPGSGSL